MRLVSFSLISFQKYVFLSGSESSMHTWQSRARHTLYAYVVAIQVSESSDFEVAQLYRHQKPFKLLTLFHSSKPIWQSRNLNSVTLLFIQNKNCQKDNHRHRKHYQNSLKCIDCVALQLKIVHKSTTIDTVGSSLSSPEKWMHCSEDFRLISCGLIKPYLILSDALLKPYVSWNFHGWQYRFNLLFFILLSLFLVSLSKYKKNWK